MTYLHYQKGFFSKLKEKFRKEYMKRYRIENKSRMQELNKSWYEKNKDSQRQAFQLYYSKNKEQRRSKGKKHYEENKSIYLAYSKHRKWLQKNRTPKWLSKEQKKQCSEFYKLAKQLELETGKKYHVDHIIPLQGNTVCGLHVPWNLRVISSEENLSKSNKLLEEFND